MSKVIRLSDKGILYLDTFRTNRIRQLELLCDVYNLDPEDVRASISDVLRMSDTELLHSALDYACHQLEVDIDCLTSPNSPEPGWL